MFKSYIYYMWASSAGSLTNKLRYFVRRAIWGASDAELIIILLGNYCV